MEYRFSILPYLLRKFVILVGKCLTVFTVICSGIVILVSFHIIYYGTGILESLDSDSDQISVQKRTNVFQKLHLLWDLDWHHLRVLKLRSRIARLRFCVLDPTGLQDTSTLAGSFYADCCVFWTQNLKSSFSKSKVHRAQKGY